MALKRRSYLKRSGPPARRSRPLWEKRAKVKAAGGIDPDSWQHVVSFYAGRCAYCETAPWSQQDHVRPLSRGGAHVIGNVVPACEPCNMRKGTQTWPVTRPHRFMGQA